MGAISIAYTFSAGQVAEASEINANFDPMYSTLSSGVNSENLAPSGVTTSRIQDSAVDSSHLADSAVTTIKISDSAATIDKISIPVIQSSGADPSAGGVVFSDQFSTAVISSTSITIITGSSATITTTGAPVKIQVIATTGLDDCYISISGSQDSGSSIDCELQLFRSSTKICGMPFTYNLFNPVFNVNRSRNVQATLVQHVDLPGSGTHTYTLRAFVGVSETNLKFEGCRLMAYELR